MAAASPRSLAGSSGQLGSIGVGSHAGMGAGSCSGSGGRPNRLGSAPGGSLVPITGSAFLSASACAAERRHQTARTAARIQPRIVHPSNRSSTPTMIRWRPRSRPNAASRTGATYRPMKMRAVQAGKVWGALVAASM